MTETGTVTVPSRALAVVAVVAVVAISVAVLGIGGAYLVGDAHAGTPRSVAAVAPTSPGADASAAPGVTVSGVGRVTGTPDVAHLSMGVAVTRGDVAAGLNAANAALTRVRDALRKNGVATKDLQTSGLSIQPSYDNKGKVNGYQVSESLTATLRTLTRAGHTVSAAVDAGGNDVRLNGIYFDLESDTALVSSARSAAFAEAKAKAQAYADAAGRDLGAVTSISEQVAQPIAYADRSAAGAGASAGAQSAVPLDAGTQDVTVTVTVVWALR